MTLVSSIKCFIAFCSYDNGVFSVLGEDVRAEEPLLFGGVCGGPYSLLVPCSSGGAGPPLQMVCSHFLHV